MVETRGDVPSQGNWVLILRKELMNLNESPVINMQGRALSAYASRRPEIE